MKVLDVVDRKEASGSKVIRTKWVVTNKGTPEKPNVWARWVAQEYKRICEHYTPTPGLDLVKGVLSHAAAAGKSKDHVVAVVDVRRAYFYAEPLLRHRHSDNGACTEQDKLQGRGNVRLRKVSRRLGW